MSNAVTFIVLSLLYTLCHLEWDKVQKHFLPQRFMCISRAIKTQIPGLHSMNIEKALFKLMECSIYVNSECL